MIYFMQSVDGGPLKIGFSDDVDRRREQLEATYGCPLALLATMEGGRDEERAIHARFSHLRIGRTEQFRPASDLMAFIGRPLLVGPNPEAVMALSNVGRSFAVVIKGNPEWRAWVEELAKHCRMSVSGMTDFAYVQLAKQVGFEKKPPDR